MKNLLLTFALIVSALAVSGQARYGIKASIGKNMAGPEMTAVGQPFDFINHEVNYTGSNAVKNIGVFYQKKFGYLFMRSELGYTEYTQKYDVQSFTQVINPNTFASEKFQYIDFQALAGYTYGDWRLGIGPIAHILVNQNTELDFISGFESRTRNVTFGMVTGIGFDKGPISLDVRYEVAYRTVGEHLYYVNRDAGSEERPNILSFTVGVAF